jgi:hypothetical protein
MRFYPIILANQRRERDESKARAEGKAEAQRRNLAMMEIQACFELNLQISIV